MDVYIALGMVGKYEGLYKIGSTSNIEKRLKGLDKQYGLVWPIRVFEYVRPSYEHELQDFFDTRRVVIDNHWEWFALTKEDIKFIKELPDDDGKYRVPSESTYRSQGPAHFRRRGKRPLPRVWNGVRYA